MNAHEDPRWTAYTLGELEESERASIEAELRADPAARRAVDEVRATARLLESELAREEGSGLTSSQRAAIESLATEQGSHPRAVRRPRSTARVAAWGGLALAASVVLAFGISTWMRGDMAVATGELVAPGRAPAPAAGERRLLDGLGYAGGEDKHLTAHFSAPQEEILQDRTGEAEFVVPNSEVDRDEPEAFDTEAYARIVENPFLLVRDAPLSTFSIDVNTASYSNVRRFLAAGELPPPDAVRIEELLNYFPYSDAGPTDSAPFAVHVETASCPWAPRHRLMRVALVGREIGEEGRKPTNLVFLIDVSGSMNDPMKLPLLKSAMQMLVQQLDERDRIAIVVYAGAAGLVLPSTSAADSWAISEAIERLEAGGSTAGGAGIALAYEVAGENFLEDGVNRVILATDGDFNVGVSNEGELSRMIESARDTGVFLSVLGFGTGNLQDSKLEMLADRGNGHYAYIDGPLEARKVLVEELGATLETIAKDVKIQIEFNPLQVEGYRLIGYENRLMAAQDFNDDTKDAGEIGAGHRVTALYEIVPAGLGLDVPGVDPLRYQTPSQPSGQSLTGELLTLKLRYKEPDASESRLIELPVRDEGGSFEEASEDLRFASSVAAFGMRLRGSKYAGEYGLDSVLRALTGSVGDDRGGYRREFSALVQRARAIGER